VVPNAPSKIRAARSGDAADRKILAKSQIFISRRNFMQRLFLAISAVVVLSGVNIVVSPGAIAAGVNCSYEACLKECQKSATPNGCSKWCNDAMMQ
jgi:hypothetical protein